MGKNAAEVLTRAQGANNKELLRAVTEEAKSIGIFGSPFFVTRGELFWGDDRLEDALAWAMAG